MMDDEGKPFTPYSEGSEKKRSEATYQMYVVKKVRKSIIT